MQNPTRFRKNSSDFVKHWSSYKRFPKVLESQLKKFDLEAQLYQYFPVEIPKQFEGCEVIDMHWSQIPVFGIGGSGNFNPVFIKDPDAVCGTAFYNPGLNPKAPYNVGYYNPAIKSGGGIALASQEIPQDGKYHLYKLGNPRIMSPLYIVLDGTWHFRVLLATVGIVPEKWDIWVSMKFSGPRFVHGSKEPNRVLFDRILLVQDPDPLRHYESVDAKNNLVKNPGFELGNGSWIANWGRGNENCMYDTAVKHSGNASLKIGNKTDGSVFVGSNLMDIKDLKHDLLVRGWYKYEGMTDANHPFIGLWTLTKEGKNGFSKPLATFYPGNYDWQKFETVVCAEDLKRAIARSKVDVDRLTFRIWVNRQPGWLWVDDVEVIPLEKK